MEEHQTSDKQNVCSTAATVTAYCVSAERWTKYTSKVEQEAKLWTQETSRKIKF
jgi:hypothetical protein